MQQNFRQKIIRFLPEGTHRDRPLDATIVHRKPSLAKRKTSIKSKSSIEEDLIKEDFNVALF